MTSKKVQKRKLTSAEEKNIRQKIQSTASYLNKILENPRINKETKDVIRKMHKCLKDAASYSGRLNYIL
jgi:uncharacterized coiled-coil DUF342 family protein